MLLIALMFSSCATASKKEEKEVFIVDLNSPKVSIGEIETQLDRTFPLPGVRKINVTVEYFPREDAVCLQYRAELMIYYQFWSRSGRAAFINALEKYKEDYEARNLDSKGGNRTKRNYGTAEGYIIWQVSRYTSQSKANVDFEIGYFFKSNAPYFTINQREGSYIDPLSEKEIKNSSQIPMYFTRAQADELAAIFDQGLLQGLVSGSANRGDNYYTDEY